MSEFHTSESMAWLETALASHLSPVAAPEALWDRIQQPPVRKESNAFLWGWWPVAATLLLMVGGGAVWRIAEAQDPVKAMEKLAQQELTAGPARLDFRSGDPSEIRTWVRTRTNIDIELPSSTSAAVQLLGTRLIKLNGEPIAAVCYQVGGDAATLLVSGRRRVAEENTVTREHAFSRTLSPGGRVFTWSMREQVYSVASVARNPQAACVLCHGEGERLTLDEDKGKNRPYSPTSGGIL